jgi:hypothetical protein
MISPREARLREASAHHYPSVPVETWLQAATVVDMVWAYRLERGEGSACLGGRILGAEHFEFRYGEGKAAAPGPHRRRARDGSAT